MPLALEMNQALFGGSPFTGFDAAAYPLDMQGWCENPDIFDLFIDQLKPSLIIHVGCWKGKSVQHLLRRAMQYQDASVICVDTWTGTAEQWTSEPMREELAFRHGRPQLYEQFMANVIHAGLQDRVVPLCLEPAHAADVLGRMKIGSASLTAPLVYLDSLHDPVSLKNAIELFWPKVCSGGILMGDDYAEPYSGVVDAVGAFRRTFDTEIGQSGEMNARWYSQRKNG